MRYGLRPAKKADPEYPLLTSRHVRQMAFDIKDLAYHSGERILRVVSRAAAGDPYQLRIYVPDGFAAKRAELSEGLGMGPDPRASIPDYAFVVIVALLDRSPGEVAVS